MNTAAAKADKSGFLMGESPVTLVIIGVVLMGLSLLADRVMDVLAWHISDGRPVAIFGTHSAMHSTIAFIMTFTNVIGSALLFFGIARLAALAAPAIAAKAAKREPPRAAL